MADQPRILRLISGSQSSILVLLLDERDRPEDIAGLTAAKLSIVGDDDVAIVELEAFAETSNAGELLFSVSAPQASAYPGTGRYRAQIAITLDAVVYKSDHFYVDFTEDIG